MPLQHLLILVKLLLRVLIPDEPDWIRKNREHIQFKSMRALREQVNQHRVARVTVNGVNIAALFQRPPSKDP